MSKIKKRCREEKYPEGLISGSPKAGQYFQSFPHQAPLLYISHWLQLIKIIMDQIPWNSIISMA